MLASFQESQLGGKDVNISGRFTNRVFLCVCVFTILLAGSLRIHRIAQRSLWLDEAIAANISRGTLAETVVLTRGLHSAPLTHPLILYAVEKAAVGPLGVRLPSLVASMLAVFLMLCFATIPAIDYKTATLSALMLSVAAAQIRYAQEVREYSLSVLYAALLVYLFLSYISGNEKRKSPIALYLALFCAPLIQYGLVLFGFGILAALLVLVFADRSRRIGIALVMKSSLFLAAGSMLSYFLTLRYQWGEKAWYLEGSYFTPGSSVARFVWSNTHHLLAFLLPGVGTALISVVAIMFYVVTSLRARVVPPLIVLALTSFGTVLACAVLRVYPYDAIRQCLFLAPVVCVLASASLAQIADRFAGALNGTVFVAIACVVVASGIFQIRSMRPYAEVEDIQSVLEGLRNHIEPGDGVYVYSGAVPAIDFYVKERDQRFTYGDFHREAPEEYVREMLVGLSPGTNRSWIVFSHIYDGEDQKILQGLSGEWEVEPALVTKGAALYLASRRNALVSEPSAKRNMGRGEAVLKAAAPRSDHARDSFWEWNIRNSRRSIQ